MLSTFARFLRNAESLNFTLSRDKSGQVRILVQPVLGPEPEGLDDEAKQLRAYLAKPLLTTATEAELDEVLPSLLGRVATARDNLSTMYESIIAEMNQQAEAARRSAEAKAAAKVGEKKDTSTTAKAKTSTPTPPPTATAPTAPPPAAVPSPAPADSTSVQLF